MDHRSLQKVSSSSGVRLFVDPKSKAFIAANSLRKDNPSAAALLDKIAQQPQAVWLGEWSGVNIRAVVSKLMHDASIQGTVPVIVLYNIPKRDAAASAVGAGHSAGGLDSNAAYHRWVAEVSAGLGNQEAFVILEPDALPGLNSLPESQREDRLELLRDAAALIARNNTKASVYLDAGHPAWIAAEVISERLLKAGVTSISGFSLNISHCRTTEECIAYGHRISALCCGKHFVIDTSRNGAGPHLAAKNEEESWCNPPGRKIGHVPTTDVADPLVDAFFWIKRPGESDGEGGGGPKAGVFWPEMALSLVQ